MNAGRHAQRHATAPSAAAGELEKTIGYQALACSFIR